MGEAASQTVAEMEQARTALDHDLDELETAIRRKTDWKSQARNHPWFLAGCLFLVGLLITKLVRS